MVKTEFTFPSADGKTAIHAVEWVPEEPVRAVLQISHGVSEYILRYESLAAYLTEQGFAVVGHDHLGHGTSVAAGAPRLYFGPKGSWNWVVDDLYTRRQLAGRRFPGVPCFLLGHSMGSFLARCYLIRYPGTVDGAILMGTGQMAPALIAAGRSVAAEEALRVGEKHPSPLVTKLAFETYNKRFAPNRTGFDWLSLSTDNVDRYLQDPLCGENPSIGLFREMLWGMAFMENAANLRKMNANTPILFISGAMDPVGDCGKGVRQACRGFEKAGMRHVSLRLYPGLRHEILQEDCYETVYHDLYQWLSEQLPVTPTSAAAPPHPLSGAESGPSTPCPQ
jgi:alpha-beta hydrolase superfamily lysophospholipase